MLAERGHLLVGVGAGLVALGLILGHAGALLVGVVLLAALVLQLRWLRGQLGGGAPWGLRISLGAPAREASVRGLDARSHRVGHRLRLELHMALPPGRPGLRLRPLEWRATDGLEVAIAGREVPVAAAGEAAVAVDVTARTAAIHRVFGLRAELIDAHGLLRAEVFLPCSYEIAVLPRSLPLDSRHLAETRRNVQRAAGGTRPDRVAGQGDELRELREHLPGDAFKHIAWKASARRGRLMSRVFEHERARALFSVLDVGATMREGRLGAAPLDQGLDLVHSLAELSARRNLPFGLSLVDGEVVDRRPVLEGLPAVRACDAALLDVRRAVAERLAPMPEDALLELVAGYLRSIDQVDLPRGQSGAEWVAFRQRTVMAALARLPERERSPLFRGPEPSLRADLSILRRFCRAADLALPYRDPLPPATRADGLAAGIEAARRAKKGPFVIVVASDFHGLRGQTDPILRAAAAARAAGHRVIAVSLREHEDDALLEHTLSPETSDTARGLWRADRAAREALHDELRHGLRRAGAAFVDDPAPGALVHLWAAGAFR
ncbi:MAG: DUF58 domain-containing protein [Deltaproteobacteria bacterium]|nr:DUF58 domain-containing protein [Deltaproteobacteria bacterium]